MDEATRKIVTDVTRDSDEERSTFPEVVGRLVAAGVERYHMDMVRGERAFYMPDGTNESVFTDKYPPVAQSFVARDVDAAVRAIQRDEIQYQEFCRRITQAGCVGYHVFITGQRVVYYGRTGEQHIEYFPGAKP
jgi:uncharacterized protein YbcV (DUF1398 family)